MAANSHRPRAPTLVTFMRSAGWDPQHTLQVEAGRVSPIPEECCRPWATIRGPVSEDGPGNPTRLEPPLVFGELCWPASSESCPTCEESLTPLVQKPLVSGT